MLPLIFSHRSLFIFLLLKSQQLKMNVFKLSCCSCTVPRALTCTQQPTAAAASLSQSALKAVFDWSACKEKYRMGLAPLSLPSLRPKSLSRCPPVCQEGLCVKSTAATAAPAASARTHARTHRSGLPQQQKSTYQRLKTPTDARHYAILPRLIVILNITNCTAALFRQLCRSTSMLC